MEYTGYTKISLKDEELSKFYQGDQDFINKLNLFENQYLVLQDSKGEDIDIYCYQENEFKKVTYPTIENRYIGKIKPRNLEQKLAIDMLQDGQSKVKLIKGVYGSGKDLLMANEALSQIEKGNFEKIVFIRPNVTVKDVPEIGYLKGDLADKLDWTLGPLYDKVGGKAGLEQLQYQGKLEMMPLLFIRGRSFENSIIYVTEGQNTTTEIIKLLLGRVGENSELWINADTHQTDHKTYEKDNGITTMIDKLKGNSLFAYVYLPKTERSDVANLANLLD